MVVSSSVLMWVMVVDDRWQRVRVGGRGCRWVVVGSTEVGWLVVNMSGLGQAVVGRNGL